MQAKHFYYPVNRELGLGGCGGNCSSMSCENCSILSATALPTVSHGKTLWTNSYLRAMTATSNFGGQGASLNSVFHSDDPLLAALYLCWPFDLLMSCC